MSLCLIGAAGGTSPRSASATTATFQPSAGPRRVTTPRRLPLRFEENRGQTDRRVEFLARGGDYTLFLTPSESVLTLRRAKPDSPVRDARKTLPKPEVSVLRMKLLGANRNPRMMGADELPGKSNYFIGSDRRNWQTSIPTYAKVKYEEVYPGVDLVYRGGDQSEMEYDFVVGAGRNPRTIKIAFEGAKKIELDGRGSLLIHLSNGEVIERRPEIYQEVKGERREVAGAYVICGKNQVGFDIPAYDRSRPLVIDPTLVYSTFLSGPGTVNEVQSIAADSAGNLYVTGRTNSLDFPTTAAAFTPSVERIPIWEVFVAKINPSLSGAESLIYSTYLGTNGTDEGLGIAVDKDGDAYVTGSTIISEPPSPGTAPFPTTPNAYQTTNAGRVDAFVTVLNPTGSALLYSTCLGGELDENGDSIAIDTAGNAYVTGYTSSSSFPDTGGGFGPHSPGVRRTSDIFVAKINPAASGLASLVYSTILNGSGYDVGASIAVDASGNAYIAAFTQSADLPIKNGFQTKYAGDQDAFMFKLNSAGVGTYSTYLGGSQGAGGRGIAVDGAGNAYVSGFTQSRDFPTTPGVFQPNHAADPAGYFDAFVTKINPSLAGADSLVYSTYLGGNRDDVIRGIAVDGNGNAYVTGYTSSTDLPTINPIQASNRGGHTDVFVSILNASATTLLFSTYLGSTDTDKAFGIAIDSANNVYVTGAFDSDTLKISSNFPTVNAFQPVPESAEAGFISKIEIGQLPTPTATPTATPVPTSTPTATTAPTATPAPQNDVIVTPSKVSAHAGERGVDSGKFSLSNFDQPSAIDIASVMISVSNPRVVGALHVFCTPTGGLPAVPAISVNDGASTVVTFTPGLKLAPGQGVDCMVRADISQTAASIDSMRISYAAMVAIPGIDTSGPWGPLAGGMGVISLLMIGASRRRRLVLVFVVAGVLGAGIAGCGNENPAPPATISTQRLEPVTATNDTTGAAVMLSGNAGLPATLGVIRLK